ncbi:corrinoid protein [Natranaerofaba carboxydovora]|uniref:corrinoid protein n=1 Tax=Natranaerofaba carboxydovora TaxID=2742683 RepID=UPI001F13453E|nr:corrinoid protein [Natranaerofaba carboxydovora]UMZ73619.1 Methionine synthase [Natranaerofaba carboxydovora]
MEDFFQKIREAIYVGEAEKVMELTKEALKKWYPPEVVLEKGIISGIDDVAKKFKNEKVLVPEVLMSARAMYAGYTILEPYFKSDNNHFKAKAVLGTVEGDIHDIGKNLVKIYLNSLGVKVIDLGVDITVEGFVKAVKEEEPDFLMISALLTTTMKVMQDIIKEVNKLPLRKNLKIVVGGTPVTDVFANEIGADYYFSDALETKDYLEKNLKKMLVR